MSTTMSGLTVRWSLADAPSGSEIELASYVEETSHARFTGMEGLRFKTWRMRAGEWFEGCYVFVDEAARDEFQRSFSAIWIAAAIGIASSAPRIPSSADPASTARIVTIGSTSSARP